MKFRMDMAPHLISLWFEAAERCRGEYEEYMQQADDELDPERRETLLAMASIEMRIANVMQDDAEWLLEQFEAAGGVFERGR
jgi:hypothetical protein